MVKAHLTCSVINHAECYFLQSSSLSLSGLVVAPNFQGSPAAVNSTAWICPHLNRIALHRWYVFPNKSAGSIEARTPEVGSARACAPRTLHVRHRFQTHSIRDYPTTPRMTLPPSRLTGAHYSFTTAALQPIGTCPSLQMVSLRNNTRRLKYKRKMLKKKLRGEHPKPM